MLEIGTLLVGTGSHIKIFRLCYSTVYRIKHNFDLVQTYGVYIQISTCIQIYIYIYTFPDLPYAQKQTYAYCDFRVSEGISKLDMVVALEL